MTKLSMSLYLAERRYAGIDTDVKSVKMLAKLDLGWWVPSIRIYPPLATTI
jgi:hypothetical protein